MTTAVFLLDIQPPLPFWMPVSLSYRCIDRLKPIWMTIMRALISKRAFYHLNIAVHCVSM